MAELHYGRSAYGYVLNNPMLYTDPHGLDTLNYNNMNWGDYRSGEDYIALNEAYVNGSRSTWLWDNQLSSLEQRVAMLAAKLGVMQDGLGSLQLQQIEGSPYGDILTGTEKHFNGSLGTIGVAVQGYSNISNDVKRTYAYKLSKMTGLKSGQIFQGAKGFANSTGKLVSKLGPAGTLLGVGVAGYEIGTDTWDAHTAVNIGLMAGAAAATFFAAPVVLTGIAIYGVADYFFDIGVAIDRNVGRNSGIWRP